MPRTVRSSSPSLIARMRSKPRKARNTLSARGLALVECHQSDGKKTYS